MVRQVLIGVVLLGLILVGAWVFDFLPGGEAAPGAEEMGQSGDGPRQPAPVETATVTIADVSTEISTIGTLQANESVVVAPEISGRVAEILFGEGEAVAPGEALVRLEDNVLQAELAQARTDLVLAEANYERANVLASQGTGTERARDEAVAALRSAEASLALAEAQLADATITAPFAGRIGLRSVSVGDFVVAGERIANLEQVQPLKVDFRVPELFLSQIEIGQSIAVTVDAFPGETFDGRIYAADPQIDVNGRALQLRAQIPNEDERLRPGLFARVAIIADVREDALLVPEAALVPQGDQKFVYAVVDGTAVMTEVRIGKRQDGMVEIVSGLDPGAVVVTAGQSRLRDGAPVAVINPAPTA